MLNSEFIIPHYASGPRQALRSAGGADTPAWPGSAVAASLRRASRTTSAEGSMNPNPASYTAWSISHSSAMNPYPANRWVYPCCVAISTMVAMRSLFSSAVRPE